MTKPDTWHMTTTKNASTFRVLYSVLLNQRTCYKTVLSAESKICHQRAIFFHTAGCCRLPLLLLLVVMVPVPMPIASLVNGQRRFRISLRRNIVVIRMFNRQLNIV
jgi:hypothetical protein